MVKYLSFHNSSFALRYVPVQVGAVKIYVVAVEALKKKEREGVKT
jgi:hypothetical protein